MGAPLIPIEEGPYTFLLMKLSGKLLLLLPSFYISAISKDGTDIDIVKGRACHFCVHPPHSPDKTRAVTQRGSGNNRGHFPGTSWGKSKAACEIALFCTKHRYRQPFRGRKLSPSGPESLSRPVHCDDKRTTGHSGALSPSSCSKVRADSEGPGPV